MDPKLKRKKLKLYAQSTGNRFITMKCPFE